MKLPESGYNGCALIGSSLHGVDSKPLETLILIGHWCQTRNRAMSHFLLPQTQSRVIELPVVI